MSLTEAQPWNVCYRPELAQQAPKALLDVGFLAARHPGARNWGWGRVKPRVSASTLLSEQIRLKTS